MAEKLWKLTRQSKNAVYVYLAENKQDIIIYADIKENIIIPKENIHELIRALVDLSVDIREKEESAKEIVEKIVEDITSRLGLKEQWDYISHETREEIKNAWENIIFNNQ